MDDLTAERYAPRRRRKVRPDEPDPSPPSEYELVEKRRRILVGKELPEDREPSEYPQVVHKGK
jgi:hypothetical protein